MSTAIVGGGMAGLAAAWELHVRGAPFALFEASGRLGGLVHTEMVDGFLLEGGPDSFLSSKPEALALCRELGLQDHLVPTNPDRRTVWVRRRGALHPLPEGMVLGVPTRVIPLLRSGLFSWRGKLRLALEPLVPSRGDVGDESLAEFLRRRLGQEAVERVGQPLLAGIHAGDAARLSARATFPRLLELEGSHGSLARGLRESARGEAAAPFLSLRAGLGELVQALSSRLPAASLHLHSSVHAIHREKGGYRLMLAGGAQLTAPAVIVAVPPPAASALLADTLSPRAVQILREVRFASTATVLLGYERKDVAHPLDGYGFVCVPGEGRLLACTFLSSKLPGRAPASHVLLRAFVGGVRDAGVLELDDDSLLALVRRELGEVVGLRGAPVVARAYRWPQAIPQMEMGHRQRIAELDRELAETAGLYLTGAGLRGAGIPDVVADARRAAAAAVSRA